MNFIKLTYLDNTFCWVNMYQVIGYEKASVVAGSRITTNAGDFNVKETPAEITTIISNE